MQSVLDRINAQQTLDSKVREDGWMVTSDLQHEAGEPLQYVAFNKYAKSNHDKVVYVLSVNKRQGSLRLRLYITANNPRVNDFRIEVKRNSEDFRDFNGKRECGVERNLTLDGDINVAIAKVFDELDELYKTYNAVVDADNVPQTKESCKKAACVEADLPVQQLVPKYDLHWNGWPKFYSEWNRFVKNWFKSKVNPDYELTKEFKEIGAFESANNDTGLIKDELPEPYYGNGKNAKCVVVNLNPGASDKKETAKIFGKGGFLILSF